MERNTIVHKSEADIVNRTMCLSIKIAICGINGIQHEVLCHLHSFNIRDSMRFIAITTGDT